MDVKEHLEHVLKARFKDPKIEADLRPHGRVDALIVSSSFEGVDDRERQRLVWEALRAEMDKAELQLVSFVLAISPDEEFAMVRDSGVDEEKQ